jgi:endonuclease/exonuclease/phosphatase family metal-dependent hydrolase
VTGLGKLPQFPSRLMGQNPVWREEYAHNVVALSCAAKSPSCQFLPRPWYGQVYVPARCTQQSRQIPLKIATWNVEWATPRSRRTPEILRRLEDQGAEVICLTETDKNLLTNEGHTIAAQPDYGYGLHQNRRKALLWSNNPWKDVDDAGHEAMPPGRFISGVTETSLGELTVIGICIPWSGCRTEARRGPHRKRRWEDHRQYLECLTQVINRHPARRLVVMGDFNQIIGAGSRAPRVLQAALKEAFPPRMEIVTSDLAFSQRKSIDHIALSEDLSAECLGIISNVHEGGNLSDHFGVYAHL